MESRVNELEVRLRETERGVAANAASQSTHEQVCAERYRNLERQNETIAEKLNDGKERFRRMELIVIAALIAATGGPAAVETAYRVINQAAAGGG